MLFFVSINLKTQIYTIDVRKTFKNNCATLKNPYNKNTVIENYILRISKDIKVEFDKEVGKQKGSWKGGTIGCGYKMLPNETPLECLIRMEKERKF